MKSKFLSACLLALTSFATLSYGKEEKPLDAFIRHVGESHSFNNVNDIWQVDRTFDKTDMLKNVAKGHALTIDYAKVAEFMKKKMTAIDLVIPTEDGGSYTISLARYDYFTNDFEVHAIGKNESDTKFDYTPGLYYSGIVKGMPGSFAAFSFFNNEVYGIFSIPGEPGNHVLVPNTMVGEYFNYNQHYILYNDNDILFKENGPKCGADELPELMPRKKPTTTQNNNVYNNCTEVRCYEVIDSTMYRKKGANLTNVTNYITGIFNVKATIYRNEGIPIVEKYIEIHTTTDRYAPLPTTSSSIWLDTFGKITQNNMHGCDQATLFTTKGGTMGGVAWLGTMCMAYQASSFAGPYAFCNFNNSTSLTVSPFATYSWEVEVSAHEMGHNLGSPHTHRCCWGPTRTTAIDGCYTIEGTCADPGDPASSVGGTIMSYCHLTSSTIKFVNGFGQQPGDTVRYFLKNTFGSSCGAAYNPGKAVYVANSVKSANRECTSLGTTYYWFDNNTASHADDTLVLMIVKGTNNIGNLNTTGFSVKSGTTAGWGAGSGVAATFPSGTAGVGTSNVLMNRYWQVNATTRPTTSVEVIFPFTYKDTADVDGSVTGSVAKTSLKVYKADSGINAIPAASFTGATAANFKVYSYGGTASTTNWSLTSSGDTCYAHMLMTGLSGIGSMFYPTSSVSAVGSFQGSAAEIKVFPNPTNDNWFVTIDGSEESEMTMQIYAADGKVVMSQALVPGTVNTVSSSKLPVGMYYFRIIGKDNTYTGSLMKQ